MSKIELWLEFVEGKLTLNEVLTKLKDIDRV